MWGDLDTAEVQQAIEKALPEERIKLQTLLAELETRKKRDTCQENYLEFVRHIWPEFIEGAHLRRMAELFNSVARGEKKRVIINMAPRHSKSENASYLFPAWFLGKFPKKKIMQVSNTGELAEGFGRKVRNLLDTEDYRTIFPEVQLRADSKAAGRWNTNYNGEYYACGIGAALAGRGADLCLAEGSIIHNGRQTPIEDIQIGDKIATATGWEKVTKKKLTIHQEGVSINNEVTASKEHPFMTQRGWVNAGDLTTRDKILTRTLWQTLKQMLSTHLNSLLARLGKG